MPQGKLKKKAQVPTRKNSKFAQQKKTSGVKKGGRYIAPKKAKEVRLSKLKKNLERVIGSKIEKDAIAMAASHEPRSLKLVSQPKPNAKGKQTSKKK